MSQTSFIACLRFSTPDGCLYATLSFIIVHRFLFGLRYGVFSGHSRTESVTTFHWWEGVPSSNKIVQPWTCICSFRFSLSNSTYLGPFIVVLGKMKYRPAAPCHDMAPQIIWLSGCFNVATTNFWPNGFLMWQDTNCCMIHSTENNTFFHSASVQWRWCLVSGVTFVPACGTWVHILCWDV